MRTAQLRAVLPRELMASVVVFLVALPLCMGIAIASGMPPAKGLITGIIGGLVVGWLAGAPLQVSGPAAGLAVLVLQMGPGAGERGVEHLLNELVAGAAAGTMGEVDAAVLEVEGAHVAGLDGAHVGWGLAGAAGAVAVVGARWRP